MFGVSSCKRKAKFGNILPPVVSAKLSTKNSFSFRYGKVEIRAKLPKGNWIFPELVLQPTNENYNPEKYQSDQLRIAFIRGNTILINAKGEDISGKKLFGGAILTNGDKLREKWLMNTTLNENLCDRFHTYSMVWDDNSITVAIDDNIYAKLLPEDFENLYERYNITHKRSWGAYSKMGPFDKHFHIEVGLSVGGMSDFPDGSLFGIFKRKSKPWVNFDPKAELEFFYDIENWYQNWLLEKPELIVDYVRVYAL